MPPEKFKEGKFVLIDKNTEEETELSGIIRDLEIKETPNDSTYNGTSSILTTPTEGTIKFKSLMISEFKEARRLFNILKHTKKLRTKKKLVNRIFKEPAGQIFLTFFGH